jgi:uncharacterized protein
LIRKLTDSDNKLTMYFLKQEAAINLFIIGDIEAFGYNTEFQELWGDFTDDSQLRAVLLRFYDAYIPYANGEFDADGFISIITKNENLNGLSGKSDVISKLAYAFSEYFPVKQETYFAECTADSFVDTETKGEVNIKHATVDDVDRIIALRGTIKEFIPNPSAKEILVQSMKANTARTYYIEDDDAMAALASTTAENSLSAMVVGVCTSAIHRKKGYATKALIKLTRDILAEGKTLCLFYDNPAAGRIYNRLGYQNIGMWTLYRK